jgi:hypothetical protein
MTGLLFGFASTFIYLGLLMQAGIDGSGAEALLEGLYATANEFGKTIEITPEVAGELFEESKNHGFLKGERIGPPSFEDIVFAPLGGDVEGLTTKKVGANSSYSDSEDDSVPGPEELVPGPEVALPVVQILMDAVPSVAAPRSQTP